MNHADIYNTVRIALEGWWDFIPTGAINSVIEKLKKSGYLIDKEKEDEKVRLIQDLLGIKEMEFKPTESECA